MLREAAKLLTLGDNIAIKVPLTLAGLRACKTLSDDGIMVNVTLCFSATQALLAAKAGAAFISPFVGRHDDVGLDGMGLIADIRTIYDNYAFDTEILVASVRHPVHVLQAAKIGADIATMPPAVIRALASHPLTDRGLEGFAADWAKDGAVDPVSVAADRAALTDHPAAALIVRWAASMTDGRRLSPLTVRAYVATLHRFVGFVAAHTGGPVDAAALSGLTLTDFRAYLADRRTGGLVNASVAREIAALRTFFTFAQRHGVTGDALTGLAAPKRAVRVPRPVAPADARALIADVGDAATAPWVAARDTAVLLLLYGAGLRIAEALALTGGALPLGATLTVTGKRAKTRIVPLLPVVRTAVEAYVAQCPWPITAVAPLFRGVRGGALDAAIVRRAMAAARTALGLPASATPHALRHSFATHLLARGGRPACDPGTARPRQPVVDPGLHRGRRRAPARRLPPRPSAGVMARARAPDKCSTWNTTGASRGSTNVPRGTFVLHGVRRREP